jgi:hypothetical protein
MAISEKDVADAEARANETRRAGYAIRARYDGRRRRIIIGLDSGLEITVPAEMIEGLQGASNDELSEIEVSPNGLGLHWQALDADVYVPALMNGVFGTARFMSETTAAQMIGARGGRSKSSAKGEAARRNGQKGGRPRKTA